MYHYAANNPVRYTDPTGKFFLLDDFIFALLEGGFSKILTRTIKSLGTSWIHPITHIKEYIEYVEDSLKNKKGIEESIYEETGLKIEKKGFETHIERNLDSNMRVELDINTRDQRITFVITNKRKKKPYIGDIVLPPVEDKDTEQ